jgi:hypothetical protein
VKKIKTIVRNILRGIINRLPEYLLYIFGIGLLPLLYFPAKRVAGIFADTHDFPERLLSIARTDVISTGAWAVCVIGTALLVFLLLRSRNIVWAIARKMIIEAFHRKTVLVLLIFFLVLMPSLPFILETEGSLKSQVQIVLTYSLALAEVLLSIVAVFVCTASICSEINKKQVHITDTKPLARWQFIVGKLLGVTVMTATLLFLMTGTVYGLVRYMARERQFSSRHPWEVEEQQEMLAKVQNEVLVARKAVTPSIPDVSDEVGRRMAQLREEDAFDSPAQEAQSRKQLREALIRQRMTAAPYGVLSFTLSGLDSIADSPLYLRFKPTLTNPDAPPTVQGIWRFYLPVDNGATTQYRLAYERIGNWKGNSFQEISVPPGVIDDMGVVRVVYFNLEPNTGIQFDPTEGLEVLQRVDTFFPNYYRSVLIILCHIILLSALSLMAGAALSFPVASFTVGTIVIIGLIGPWVAENALQIKIPADAGSLELAQAYLKNAIFFVLRIILAVVPQFGRFSPIGDLVNGRAVGWDVVGRAAALMVFLKGFLALGLGAYFYWRRELARIIA